MKMFLMRLFGTSPRMREEEEKYRESLKKFDERAKDLDRLGEQIEDVRAAAVGKKEALSTSRIDFSTTMSRSLTPPEMKAILPEEIPDDPQARPPGKLAPSTG